MKVSVIIPVYNVALYVERCLDSVFRQTYRDIELIVVDDCSEDGSMDIVNRMSGADTSGMIIKIASHEHNRGPSAARNTGIKKASGDYIFFLDSDDLITEDCIEKLATPLLKSGYADFVTGDYSVTGSDTAYPLLTLPEGFFEGNDIIFHSFLTYEWYEMVFNKLINRRFLIRNRLFFEEGLLHEDVLWSFQLAAAASSMHVVRDKTYLYCVRSGSITDNFTERNLADYSKIVSLLWGWVVSEGLQNNHEVRMYIERLKKATFLKGVRMGSTGGLYPIYRGYRECGALSMSFLLKKDMKFFFWEVQYHFPVWLGYGYCILLSHLFNLIKTRDGK